MDDIFGGADTLQNAQFLKTQLIYTGKITSTVMNPKKCKGPSQILSILGFQYDAILRRVNLPQNKRTKYLDKLLLLLSSPHCSWNDLEQLLGYLGYAAWVEPFGKPFLSALCSELYSCSSKTRVHFGRYTVLALRI